MIVPAEDDERLARAAAGLARELDDSLAGFHLTIGRSRRCRRPGRPLPRRQRGAARGQRRRGRGPPAARLRGHRRLPPAAAGDERGPGASSNASTPRRSSRSSAYDEQYETELVATVEAYLDNDGNVAATAKQLFTHRHTIRYRLERVKELCGHDVSATEGREKLGLGLKAMRVLGIASPRGPALEPGAEARQGAARVGGVATASSGGRARTLASWTKTRRASRLHHPGSSSGPSAQPSALIAVRGAGA